MQYCIITTSGFQMDGNEAAVYETMAEAMGKMAPGDQIVPILGPNEMTVSFIDDVASRKATCYDREND